MQAAKVDDHGFCLKIREAALREIVEQLQPWGVGRFANEAYAMALVTDDHHVTWVVELPHLSENLSASFAPFLEEDKSAEQSQK